MLTGQSAFESGIIGIPADINCTVDKYLDTPSISSMYGDKSHKCPITIFEMAKQYNPALITAASYSWGWHELLLNANYLDFNFNARGNDEAATQKMIDLIQSEQPPNLMYLHLNDPDIAGERTFWGSTTYYDAVKKQDIRIGKLVNSLKSAGIYEQTMIVITADHGGIGNAHFHNHVYKNPKNIREFKLIPEILYIPMIFHGPNIPQNETYEEYVSIVDLAAFALNVLNVPIPPYIRGRMPPNLGDDGWLWKFWKDSVFWLYVLMLFGMLWFVCKWWRHKQREKIIRNYTRICLDDIEEQLHLI